MEKEFYIRWNNGKSYGSEGSEGGTFKLTLNGDMFSYEIVSGSSIPSEEFIGFLWQYPALQEWRDFVKMQKRKNSWSVSSHTGMSGATDWWIQYLNNYGIVKSTKPIFHDSMNSKANMDLKDIWIKDLYDLLWSFERNGIFPNSFKPAVEEDGTVNSSYGFEDITETIEERKNRFFKDCYDSCVGFGGDEPIDEDKLYGSSKVDYSNYTPTDEPDSDDLYQEQELRDQEKNMGAVKLIIDCKYTPTNEDEDDDEYV